VLVRDKLREERPIIDESDLLNEELGFSDLTEGCWDEMRSSAFVSSCVPTPLKDCACGEDGVSKLDLQRFAVDGG